ncbi:MAG TPA: hypothetical protein VF545_07605 [Thermoleophilaceae bacterium]|jgi:hypothetical protein
MRLGRGRGDKRSWNRRLADEETREFVERELEETREVFRTATGEFQLEGLCRDAFAAASTTDLRWLRSRGIGPGDFYRTELAPSWEGLDQAERAARIERFIELSNMLGGTRIEGEPSEQFRDLVASVHVKVLLLAWAYDRTYGFIDRIFNGPLQYRHHRVRATRRGFGARRARSRVAAA